MTDDLNMSGMVPPKRSAKYLKARAVIAGDLYRARKISCGELLRLQDDATAGTDSGDIKYLPGMDPRKRKKKGGL